MFKYGANEYITRVTLRMFCFEKEKEKNDTDSLLRETIELPFFEPFTDERLKLTLKERKI